MKKIKILILPLLLLILGTYPSSANKSFDSTTNVEERKMQKVLIESDFSCLDLYDSMIAQIKNKYSYYVFSAAMSGGSGSNNLQVYQCWLEIQGALLQYDLCVETVRNGGIPIFSLPDNGF